jgi:hypothetical protein
MCFLLKTLAIITGIFLCSSICFQTHLSARAPEPIICQSILTQANSIGVYDEVFELLKNTRCGGDFFYMSGESALHQAVLTGKQEIVNLFLPVSISMFNT